MTKKQLLNCQVATVMNPPPTIIPETYPWLVFCRWETFLCSWI